MILCAHLTPNPKCYAKRMPLLRFFRDWCCAILSNAVGLIDILEEDPVEFHKYEMGFGFGVPRTDVFRTEINIA